MNDYGSRLFRAQLNVSVTPKISDIIFWDNSLPEKLSEKENKRVIIQTRLLKDNSEIIMIVQSMNIEEEFYYNITLIDNLEDIKTLESRQIDLEIQGNSLFSNIFKYSPIGLILVDNDSKLYQANKYMFDCFDLKYEEVIGSKFGNIFRCSQVAGTKKICGETQGCNSCSLKMGVESVLVDRHNIEGVEIGQEFDINGRTVKKWFTVSASPVVYGEEIFALVSFVDITPRVRMENRLRELGITDGLTGLYNRRHIMQLLMDALDNENEFETLTVSLIDIDDFKLVNDNYGHLVGDDVLILLADILKSQLRFSDYVGRYGGEEFLVIFTDTKLLDADSVMMRIQSELRTKSKEPVKKVITFSSGLVEVKLGSNLEATHITHILNMTDQKLYEAKASGKDCIKVGSYER